MIESDLRRNHPLKGNMDKAEQKEELMDKKLGIIPKEPQWRPADPVDWPKPAKVNETNTLENPYFEEGNWPGYLGHGDDFRP